MSIKDYFKLDFKKPDMDSETTAILKRKEGLENKLENLYSRLETVEICNSNSKFFDSEIISNSLFKDIIEFATTYENKNANQLVNDFTNLTSETEINSAFSETYNLLSLKSIDEDHITKIEESLSNLIYKLEKYIFSKNKKTFENNYSSFKKRIQIQSIIASIVFIFLSYQAYLFYKKNKPVNPDIAKLYYLAEKAETPSAANMIQADITPGETWQEAKFILPKPSEVLNVKFEPIKQDYIRIQFKEVRYLDEKGLVKNTKSLKLNSIGMVDNKPEDEICCLEGFKPGKLLPEKYIEFETLVPNTSFYIKQPKMKDIKEIVLVYRYIKNTKKFKD
jgi:hypothetical protein